MYDKRQNACAVAHKTWFRLKNPPMSSLQKQTGSVPCVQVQPVLSVPLSVLEVWPRWPPVPDILHSSQNVSYALPTCKATVFSSSKCSRLRSLDRQTARREELWSIGGNRKQRIKHPCGMWKQYKRRSNGVQAGRGIDQCKTFCWKDNNVIWGLGWGGQRRGIQKGFMSKEKNNQQQKASSQNFCLLMEHGWRLHRLMERDRIKSRAKPEVWLRSILTKQSKRSPWCTE